MIDEDDDYVEISGSKEDDFFSEYLRPTGKLGRLLSWISFIRMAVSTGRNLWAWIQKRRQLSITIASTDNAYIDILEWVASEAFGKTAKDLALITGNTGPSYYIDDDEIADSSHTDGFKLVHNARTRQHVVVDGHKISVLLCDEAKGSDRGVSVYSSRIVFSMYTKEAQQALIDEIKKITKAKEKSLRPPKLYSPSAWQGFSIRGDLPKRDISSVILKKGEIDSLVNDMSTFLSRENFYSDLGIPWHRGYLFYGIAGTGKTSIAKALAHHFGLDMYVLPLGDMKDDSGLAKIIDGLRPRSVLLIEDIDVFSAATSREKNSGESSLSGLLNVLDGVATPHGLISILTTNDVTKLDDALVRPGRVDFKKEFTALDQDQGERLFEHFYKQSPHGVSFEGRTPAEVIEVFKNNFTDPENALRMLK